MYAEAGCPHGEKSEGISERYLEIADVKLILRVSPAVYENWKDHQPPRQGTDFIGKTRMLVRLEPNDYIQGEQYTFVLDSPKGSHVIHGSFGSQEEPGSEQETPVSDRL
jgi:hypothetical protein